jgi:hypothetical protein
MPGDGRKVASGHRRVKGTAHFFVARRPAPHYGTPVLPRAARKSPGPRAPSALNRARNGGPASPGSPRGASELSLVRV